jgi:predicted NUDIX family NTP pyrophosphohydrolase
MQQSAGILLYRRRQKKLEVFLVHPGGPFWKNKDLGAWSIPKGEFQDDEDPLKAAIREFQEETGTLLKGNFIPLATIKQKSGKKVQAWSVEGDIEASTIKSNFITIDWPPKSGKQINIPEVDRGEWFNVSTAREKINPAQALLIDELVKQIQY